MINPKDFFPGLQTLYDKALAQWRRAPTDLTDEQIQTIRLQNPQLADAALASRGYFRRSAAYQQRVAEAEYFRPGAALERRIAAAEAAEKKNRRVVRLLRH